MAEVLQIPAALVADVWAQAEPHLIEPIAMTRGRFEPEDVRGLCERGGMQLWLIVDSEIVAAAVTEIVDYPRKRVSRFVFVGGKGAKDWHASLGDAVEAWGRGWGCTGDEAWGRKGWGRLVNAEEAAVLIWREYAPTATPVPHSRETH